MKASSRERAVAYLKEIQALTRKIIAEKFPGQTLDSVNEEEANPIVADEMKKWLDAETEKLKAENDVFGMLGLTMALEGLANV